MKRDREVEALKKSLENENELTVLSTRSELLLNAEIQTNCKLKTWLEISCYSLPLKYFFFNFQYQTLRHHQSQTVIVKIARTLIPTTFIIWMWPVQKKILQSLLCLSPARVRLQQTLPMRMIFSTWTVMIWIFFSLVAADVYSMWGVRLVFCIVRTHNLNKWIEEGLEILKRNSERVFDTLWYVRWSDRFQVWINY